MNYNDVVKARNLVEDLYLECGDSMREDRYMLTMEVLDKFFDVLLTGSYKIDSKE